MATNLKTTAAGQNGGADAIGVLESDHVVIKQLLEKLIEANGAGRAAVLDELKGILTVHNATEENLVYPAVRFMAKRPGDSDKLYHQQDEAKVAVWELDAIGPADADFESKAEKFRDAVLAHIRKEEETEFPHLREAAGTAGMRTLNESVREFRAALHLARSER